MRGYPDNYDPTKDKDADYMSTKQLAYFRDMLLVWRAELSRDSQETISDLQANSTIAADAVDQADIEYSQSLELRTRDRERKLISKIDEALDRIRAGEFGFCEETGDPIGIKRLLARPIATLSIEAKRRQEQQETGYAG
ncbi:MAG: RNA polymerase-binding protein DksA [Alphaproteobacteria bacterium]